MEHSALPDHPSRALPMAAKEGSRIEEQRLLLLAQLVSTLQLELRTLAQGSGQTADSKAVPALQVLADKIGRSVHAGLQAVRGLPLLAASVSDLTQRESGVIRRIALGYSNKEIAADLALSVKTVETYKARAMEKAGLRSRVDIVQFAAERGWFLPS